MASGTVKVSRCGRLRNWNTEEQSTRLPSSRSFFFKHPLNPRLRAAIAFSCVSFPSTIALMSTSSTVKGKFCEVCGFTGGILIFCLKTAACFHEKIVESTLENHKLFEQWSGCMPRKVSVDPHISTGTDWVVAPKRVLGSVNEAISNRESSVVDYFKYGRPVVRMCQLGPFSIRRFGQIDIVILVSRSTSWSGNVPKGRTDPWVRLLRNTS